ncbi:tRNA uridine-5-carboxymethylaminomethyl(34) synthesis GTPase MnmE [Rhodoferax sp. GW822-FHT02A01]|uniref:tRNA uridine-5-carboxymethylaminomethyl(34) synthesis GTPase MnmE n=1 Tax=Rhodoferax sp. GW822-FHT02A01 TaxID=3141537 RepID=UPI00315CB7A6
MLPRHHDPVLAIATAPGRGAVGIVRISARQLSPFVQAFFGRSLPPREALYLPFSDADGIAIDRGLAIYFPGPNSFTGEDVLELQAHGGPVVLQLLLARCLQVAAQVGATSNLPVLPGLRLATAGEFSERAFLNDKIDLAQAEAIADLIDASTEAAARSAAQSLSGAFSKEVHALLAALTHLRMLVEATLDFPEEEIDFLQKADAAGQLERIQSSLKELFAKASQGALLREGIQVVIAGQPNAGKSSLLNALAGAELAIVTPIAGTTRDRVQETIQIEGVPIHVIDTAGLRESEDVVEKIGISRAWEAIAAADVVLFLHDLTRATQTDYLSGDAVIAQTLQAKLPTGVPVIEVWNKADAAPNSQGQAGITLSAKTGSGLDALRQALLQAAGWRPASGGNFIARERHIQALRRVEHHCELAADHLAAHAQSLDLLAEELRLAQGALGEITGEFSSDDLLGVIFSQFCIGK